MIAPFFTPKAGLSPSQWQTMWEYVLKRSPIDVLALQDGVGVAHATKAQLPSGSAPSKVRFRIPVPKRSSGPTRKPSLWT